MTRRTTTITVVYTPNAASLLAHHTTDGCITTAPAIVRRIADLTSLRHTLLAARAIHVVYAPYAAIAVGPRDAQWCIAAAPNLRLRIAHRTLAVDTLPFRTSAIPIAPTLNTR